MDNEKINIIIPAYNAGPFIKECIDSIFTQTINNWHIIVVDDGSTDETADIASLYPSKRVTVISQKNQGVSAARNNGLIISKSDYVLFLDADDLLSPEFLKVRIDFLEHHHDFGFCSGDMIKFRGNTSNTISYHRGCGEHLIRDILLYSPFHDTAPSNYVFRRSILVENRLLFNRLLSSTADRLFLIELSEFTHGGYAEGGPLYYRVHEKSMSNKLSEALINDNRQYYRLLKINFRIPRELKRKASFYKYSILGFSYLKIKKLKGINYLIKGIIKYPDYFIVRAISRINSSGKRK